MTTPTKRETTAVATGRTLNHPPGPTGDFLLGTYREFQREPLHALVRYHRQYGDAIRFRFFLHLYGYSFAHPEHIQHILVDNNHNYTKIPSPSFVILQPLVGNGLLTSDGDFWLRQRRLSQPAFHRQRIDGFAETMTAATVRMLDEWAAHAGRDEMLDMSEQMMRLTLEIVGRTLFSMDLTGASETVGKAFSRVNHQMTELTIDPLALAKLRLPFLPSMRRLHGDIQILDDVVNQVIRERRRSGGPDNDLLGTLMAARDESSGAMMDDKQLRDEVMTIMLAGHETTAVALSWAMYLLARHPEVARRLEAEIDEVLAGRVPTTADLPALTYNRMVIDETLRLYPPAYTIARWGHEPDRVGPFDLPADSSILLLTYVTHRHPDFWEAPDRFDPERFAPGKGADRPRFAYLPFGGGPRQCIGNNFALVEAQLLLALIVQRFRWTLPAGYHAELEPLITLRPKDGLPVRLKARNSGA